MFLQTLAGKAVIGLIVVSLVAAVSLGLYHKIVQPTSDTDYNNIIRKAQQVIVDQRQFIINSQDTMCILKLDPFKLITIEGPKQDIRDILEKSKIELPPPPPQKKNTLLWTLIIIGIVDAIALVVLLIIHFTRNKAKSVASYLQKKLGGAGCSD